MSTDDALKAAMRAVSGATWPGIPSDEDIMRTALAAAAPVIAAQAARDVRQAIIDLASRNRRSSMGRVNDYITIADLADLLRGAESDSAASDSAEPTTTPPMPAQDAHGTHSHAQEDSGA